MKRGLLILTAILCGILLEAMPAKPGFIRYTQPDGSTILLRRHGDEWDHWTANERGQVVQKDTAGFYRVVEGARARSSSSRGAVRRRAAQERAARSVAVRSPWKENRLALGRKHFLVILVEFSDLSFRQDNPQQVIGRILNEEGYSEGRAVGSARDYYFENSHGLFEPVFDIFGPVALDKEKAYYGENDAQGYDKRPEVAVRDALLKLDAQIDFTRYDSDQDGEVDLVYMVYAGYGEADSVDDDAIWPHQWYLTEGGISLALDGKKIDRYACGPELDGGGSLQGIGTICHEFGHAIGLPDFYDTDYETNGQAAGLFSYSLMDTGSYNDNGWIPPFLNIEERILLGWIGPAALQEISRNGEYTLGSVDENLAFKISTETEGEYFVLECRSEGKWDSAIPAPGLIVYHADKSSNTVRIMDSGGSYRTVTAQYLWEQWEMDNAINESGSHPCFYIVPAPDQQNLMFGFREYSGYGYYFDSSYGPLIPFPGSRNIRDYTPLSWAGNATDAFLNQISYSSGQVHFQVRGVGENPLDYPVIANPGEGRYTAGSTYALQLEESASFPVASVRWLLDGAEAAASSVVLTRGAHTIEARVTAQDGRKMQITLEIEAD